MQYSKKSITFVMTALISISAAHASIVVIGSPDMQANQLTKQQIDDIYLGKNFDDNAGEQLQPLDQPTGSLAYQQFYDAMLGWTTGQVSSYWSSQTFSGDGSAPVQVNSDAQAIATVETNHNAIAYIDSNSLKLQGGRVKVLYGDFNGSGSGNNYYPPVAASQVVQQSNAAGMQAVTQSSHQPDLEALLRKQQQKIAQLKQQQLKQQQQLLLARAQLAPKKNPVMQSTAAVAPSTVSFIANGSGNAWNEVISNFSMPSEMDNPEVKHQLLWYLSHRDVLTEDLNNAKPYLGYVLQQTQARHLPAELALLPMIESSYNPIAYSKAGAAGLWQMMPGTASSYGLDINWWYDSRSDIKSSTDAALNYLKLLHKNMGDWELALASYDAGQGAVRAAINYSQQSGNGTSFWDLPLPSETRNYVPKLLALAEIIRHADQYHVQLPFIPAQPYFSGVTLQSQLDLAEIAHLSQIPVSLVKSLNPGLRRWATDPDSSYELQLPVAAIAIFKDNLAKMHDKTHISWQYHEVREGETLAKIARNYHVHARVIRQVNQLSSNDITPNAGLLVPLYLDHKYQAVNVDSGDTEGAASDMLPKATLDTVTADNQQADSTADTPDKTKTSSLKALLSRIYKSN